LSYYTKYVEVFSDLFVVCQLINCFYYCSFRVWIEKGPRYHQVITS